MDANAQGDKVKLIRTAAIAALTGNAFLAVLKIASGIIFNSGALIGDGIDSSADVLISVLTLVVVKVISIPADDSHPWGHGRAETVATALLSFVLFFAGGQLAWNSLLSLFSAGRSEVPDALAIAVTCVSIAGKIALARSQQVLGKKSGSSIVLANAKNMLSDVFISVGVLAGLLISSATGSGIADVVLAVLIGLWVIKTAAGIFMEANAELMDGHVDSVYYERVFDAVKTVEGAGRPHRVRIRRIAAFLDIDMDIEVAAELTVGEAHQISESVEKAIKASLGNVYDIMIHIEPEGCCSADEGFGLSEKTLKNPA